MKTIITTVISLLIFSFGFSQSKPLVGEISKANLVVEALSIKITVDSIEEIESEGFQKEDIQSLFKNNANRTISVELVCNKEVKDEDVISSLVLKVDGSSNNIDDFILSFEKIKEFAINYYNK